MLVLGVVFLDRLEESLSSSQKASYSRALLLLCSLAASFPLIAIIIITKMKSFSSYSYTAKQTHTHPFSFLSSLLPLRITRNRKTHTVNNMHIAKNLQKKTSHRWRGRRRRESISNRKKQLRSKKLLYAPFISLPFR